MRTKNTKEEFITETKERIAMRETLCDFYYNTYLPTLKKFNGKVYNIRFIKALRESVAENKLFSISERKYNEGIEIRLRRHDWNYTDYETLYVKCNLNNEGRIDYEATINDEVNNAWVSNFKEYTNEYRQSIERYDEYMKVAEKLEKTLDEYNKLPHIFRNNLETSWMRIY